MQPILMVHFIVHGDFLHIETALRSLQQNTDLPYLACVTINTGDASEANRIRLLFPDVKFVENKRPRGFAANHNAAMKVSNTPFVALVNDDVEIHPKTFDTLVAYLESHPDVGLVGPLVVNPDGTPQLSSFSDPSLFRMFYKISGLGRLTRHGSLARRALQGLGISRLLGVESLNPLFVTREVPVIVGVSMVARRTAFLSSGLMDEDTLIYGEEVGWHWRLRQNGWKIALVAEARITHFNPQSDETGWKLAEHRKSIINYFVRYRPGWQAILIRLFIVSTEIPIAVICFLFSPKLAQNHWQAAKVALTWKPLHSR